MLQTGKKADRLNASALTRRIIQSLGLSPSGLRLKKSMARFEKIHPRHLADVRAYTTEAVSRLSWPRDRVLEEQTRRLRAMVAFVQEEFPYLAERTGHLEASTLELSDLPRSPS